MARPPVIEAGFLTVGVDASPPPPMQLGDPSSPEFDGYEVDLLKAIARRLGVEVRYRSALWSRLLRDLEVGKLDVVCTAATATAERRDRFFVGRPYLDLDLVAVIHSGASWGGLSDLVGQALAVRTATLAEDYVRRELKPSSIVMTEFNDEAYDFLERGRVMAVVDDEPIAGWYVAHRPALRILGPVPGSESQYAMMFARGNAQLAESMDAILGELLADGTVDRFRRRWFVHPLEPPVTGVVR